MRLVVVAIGKSGRGPEAVLAEDYARRASRAGRPLGLGPLELIDLDSRKSGREAEGALILGAAQDAWLIACDERGSAYGSRDFAQMIAELRDRGERRLVFVVGGADGLAPSVREAARSTLALGPQTWPHALARVLLTEQIYRAVTILGGAPYHRD